MKVYLPILLGCFVVSLLACQPAETLTDIQGTTIVSAVSTRAPPPDNVPSQSQQSPIPFLTQTPASTSKPTFTPFGGWLVFSSRRQDTNKDGMIDLQDGKHLYIMDLTAETTTQLTFGKHVDTAPSWSPDRRRIAFVSNRVDGSNFDLFIINVDGSELRQLTRTPERESMPAWSPDGTRIAYISANSQGGFEERRLYLISPDGGAPQQLTEGPGNDWYPDWSTDGRFLAFERVEPDGDSHIYLWEAGTGAFTKLTSLEEESSAINFGYPRWIPRTGYFLAIIRSEIQADELWFQLMVFEVQERDEGIILYQTPAEIEWMGGYHYTWGPNGEWIIASVQANRRVSYDLLRVRIRLRGKSAVCWCTDAVEKKFLTENDFYDDFPDWAP